MADSSSSSSSSTTGQPNTQITPLSKRFDGYNVIVTGGASGIGLATVVEFLKEGVSAIGIFDFNSAQAEAVVQDFHAQGLQKVVSFHKVDVTEKDACVAAVDAFAKTHGGKIHTLFNNAGCFLSKGLEATAADFHKVWSTNVLGYANMAQAVYPYMQRLEAKERKLCSIVNNSSTSATRPQMKHWTYSSSKGGIKIMTKCMALDFGNDQIRVNSISPSWTWSPEVMKAAVDGGKEKWDPIWGKFHMLGRCGECIEVARVVLFLASTDASFITGTDIPVDGGYQQMTAERLGEESNFAGSTENA